MDTYGRYRLQFEPAYGNVNPSVTMELSGEADLDQMVSLFDCFLKANGFTYKGNLDVVDEETQRDTWGGYRYPLTAQGSKATDLSPFSLFANDKINSGLE